MSVALLEVALPSTKQAMALITIDLALKNKETAIKTGAELFDIVDNKVEKYLRIITGDKAKEVVDSAKEGAKEVASSAKEVISEVKGGFKEGVEEVNAFKEALADG